MCVRLFMKTMFLPRFCSAVYMVVILHVWLHCTSGSGTSNAEPHPRSDLLATSPINSISSPRAYGHKSTGLLSRSDRRTSRTTIKPLEVIMQMPWALKLHDVLANMTFLDQGKSGFQQTRKQVTVVFGDVNYASSLFNWLVSALVVTSPPLRNIVVVSLDEELKALLDRKDITSVHVNPEAITSGQIKRKVSQIWITRCVVYRLLNYWGYDVMAYDTDAIVLRNLQDVLDMFGESDVIGSAGGYPFNLGAMWGQTLCMGVVFFKSTRKTERLWTAISQGRGNLQLFDDQVAINNVLYKCGISWSNSSSNGSQLQAVTGQCADSGDEMSGLKVTILPTSMICRKCYKKDRSGVYIWHKQSKKTGVAKMKAATTTDTWYLKSDTLMIEKDELKGTEWIRAIAKL